MQKNKITMNFLPNKTIPFSTIIIPFLCLFLILSPTPHGVAAQSPNNDSNNSNNDLAGYANFSPSMAIIIVVLVGALFFMGFFSIYIRHCSDPNSTTARTGILSVHGRRAGAGSRGLDQSVIDTFPTFTYAEVKDHKIGKGALECAVCLNEFEDSETLRLIPKCDHVFHPECIDAWLQSHMTCPVCRANLNQQPGEEGTYQMPEVSNQEDQENVGEGQRTDDAAAVEVVCEDPPERQEAVRWGMNRNFSFDPNRPSRTGSIKRGRGVFERFRSHSTGHSLGQLVQPGQNVERFTLRLPEEKRKEMMNRALLNRTKSFAPQGSNRGYRTGCGAEEGSSRGGRSYRRVEPLGREAQSDRWVFARAPSFFSRALSIRSPRDNSGEASSSTKGGKTAVRMPSFKCLEPKTADETGLVAADSARAPV